MRILFVAPSAYLLGGVQNWLDYILPGLADAGDKRGNDVVLGLVDGIIHNSVQYLAQHPYSRTVSISNPSGSRQGRVNALKKAIQQVAPDIVVCVNIGDCMAAIAELRLAKKTHARLVMTMHALERDYIAQLIHYRNTIDAVIYTNRLLGKLINSVTDFDKARQFYAPYGISIPASISDSVAKKCRILWMGRFEQQQKRCLELPVIAAAIASQTDQWELLLAGDGPMKQQVIGGFDGNISCHVTDLGHVSHDRLLEQVLPTMQILLVNSSWETGPITIWEAMAAGVSVVSSRYTGSGAENSLADQKNALMFDVGDCGGAADCVVKLINSPALRNKLIQQGRLLVSQRYSKSLSENAWYHALDSISRLPPLDATEVPGQGVSESRLDNIFGRNTAELVRRTFGVKWNHQDAGSEWPHATFASGEIPSRQFAELAASLDYPGDEPERSKPVD